MAASNDPSFTRRTVLASAGAGAGAAALGGTPALAQTGQTKTFVLVHGAWHGGWCWRRVADLLEKQGHKVFTPTLTGVGERSHLMSKDINLDTHITDLVNVFKWEDLKDVCLVVHSYGGWPGSGALEQIGDRAWVDSKTTPQPNGVAIQPIKLTGAREKVAKKTYIRAAKYPQPAFDQALAECKADKSWRTFEATESGHDVMVDAPQWLVDVL